MAGVSYQIAVTADLLVQARTGQLPLVQLVPEGYEDIDCLDREGGRLYVQTKDVGGGRGTLTASDVADALMHAAAAVGDGAVAVVTDGNLGSGLAFTGWTTTVAASGAAGVAGLMGLLVGRGLDEAAAAGLLDRAHLVQVPWHVPALTQVLLRERLSLAPAVARIVYARLVTDLAGWPRPNARRLPIGQRHVSRPTLTRTSPQSSAWWMSTCSTRRCGRASASRSTLPSRPS